MAGVGELLGESRDIQAIRASIGQLLARATAGQRLPSILIQGETGTGKGLLARALHRQSPRRDGPFVDVNCAAIPETLLEAEMFGFERGAFSDARQAKPGLLESADRGTIFLDEIGLLAEPLQAKLLKAIEERSVRRLGSTRSRSVDVWVISASNEDLPAAIRQRRFRENLYHRLAVLTLRLPPLRERGDDVLLLAEHFLAQACADYKLAPRRLADDARASLLAYPWPGNVRELANVMERAALLTEAPVVGARMLGLPAPPPDKPAPDRALRAELGERERERLVEALEGTGWNLSRAAARLGIPRNTLRYRMEKHGLAGDRAARPVEVPSAPRGSTPPAPTPAVDARPESRRLTWLRVVMAPAPGHAGTVHGTAVLDRIAEKIELFGGRVADVGSSGLVAVFGLDQSEGATSTAAHAALAATRAAGRAEGDGERRAARLAIHTGDSPVVEGGRGPEITPEAIQHATSILDALAERAAPGGIVAGGAAAPFLARRFELTALDPAAGAAFSVTPREGAEAGRRGSPFVGRQHNLDLLEEHLASALGGRGHALGIVGEAGIGKSRLVAEFRRRRAGEPLTYREGACVSYGGAIPYLPVLAILRQHCGITETDSAETTRDKVGRTLAALEMDDAAAPYLWHLLGVDDGAAALAAISPEAIKRRTLDLLRRLLVNESRRRPLVLVVEDLHWIDSTSEELLDALADNVPSAPILFLATYRPGYRPAWLDRSYATQVALSPLSPDDSLTVVRSVLRRTASEPVTRAILDRADGNPFFLEELCRVLDERSDPATVPAVPETIQDVLLARIQRLPAGPRKLLQTAAVAGREVSTRVLEALWEGPEPLDAILPALASLEFLYPRSEAGEVVYVFKHALTQEVAYGTLPPAERRRLHAAVGRALERFYEGRLPEVYDRLAHHYARTDEPAKAIEYLTRFAEKSARAYAHDDAVKALGEAQTYVERLPAEARDRATVELALRRWLSLLPLGRIPEMLALLLEQRERLERLHDPALAARYYFQLTRTYMLADHSQVMDNARRAIAEAERCGDTATTGGAYGVMALACALSGQAVRGIECGQRAVALLEKTADQWSLCYGYWALGLCQSQIGAFRDGLAAERRAVAIAETIGHQPLEASATWVLGVIHAAMGEWDEGVVHCQRAVELARHVLYQAIATGFLGFAYMEKGEAAAAIGALEEAIPPLQLSGLKVFDAWFTAFLAEAHRLEGRLDRAEELARHAVDVATQVNFPVAIGWAQQALGRSAAARGDAQTAAARFDEALRTFATIPSRYEIGRLHVDLAHVGRSLGDRDAAGRHLREAYGIFTTLDVPRFRERLERLAAEWQTPLTPDVA